MVKGRGTLIQQIRGEVPTTTVKRAEEKEEPTISQEEFIAQKAEEQRKEEVAKTEKRISDLNKAIIELEKAKLEAFSISKPDKVEKIETKIVGFQDQISQLEEQKSAISKGELTAGQVISFAKQYAKAQKESDIRRAEKRAEEKAPLEVIEEGPKLFKGQGIRVETPEQFKNRKAKEARKKKPTKVQAPKSILELLEVKGALGPFSTSVLDDKIIRPSTPRPEPTFGEIVGEKTRGAVKTTAELATGISALRAIESGITEFKDIEEENVITAQAKAAKEEIRRESYRLTQESRSIDKFNKKVESFNARVNSATARGMTDAEAKVFEKERLALEKEQTTIQSKSEKLQEKVERIRNLVATLPERDLRTLPERVGQIVEGRTGIETGGIVGVVETISTPIKTAIGVGAATLSSFEKDVSSLTKLVVPKPETVEKIIRFPETKEGKLLLLSTAFKDETKLLRQAGVLFPETKAPAREFITKTFKIEDTPETFKIKGIELPTASTLQRKLTAEPFRAAREAPVSSAALLLTSGIGGKALGFGKEFAKLAIPPTKTGRAILKAGKVSEITAGLGLGGLFVGTVGLEVAKEPSGVKKAEIIAEESLKAALIGVGFEKGLRAGRKSFERRLVIEPIISTRPLKGLPTKPFTGKRRTTFDIESDIIKLSEREARLVAEQGLRERGKSIFDLPKDISSKLESDIAKKIELPLREEFGKDFITVTTDRVKIRKPKKAKDLTLKQLREAAITFQDIQKGRELDPLLFFPRTKPVKKLTPKQLKEAAITFQDIQKGRELDPLLFFPRTKQLKEITPKQLREAAITARDIYGRKIDVTQKIKKAAELKAEKLISKEFKLRGIKEKDVSEISRSFLKTRLTRKLEKDIGLELFKSETLPVQTLAELRVRLKTPQLEFKPEKKPRKILFEVTKGKETFTVFAPEELRIDKTFDVTKIALERIRLTERKRRRKKRVQKKFKPDVSFREVKTTGGLIMLQQVLTKTKTKIRSKELLKKRLLSKKKQRQRQQQLEQMLSKTEELTKTTTKDLTKSISLQLEKTKVKTKDLLGTKTRVKPLEKTKEKTKLALLIRQTLGFVGADTSFKLDQKLTQLQKVSTKSLLNVNTKFATEITQKTKVKTIQALDLKLKTPTSLRTELLETTIPTTITVPEFDVSFDDGKKKKKKTLEKDLIFFYSAGFTSQMLGITKEVTKKELKQILGKRLTGLELRPILVVKKNKKRKKKRGKKKK